MSYNAWFQCINPQCGGNLPAEQDHLPLRTVPVRCSRCSTTWRRWPAAGRQGLDEALRGPLQDQRVALRLRRLGQEGMGPARDRRRQHRLALRGRHQPLLGRALRQDHRRRRPLGQAVRQHPQRLVQGPRHDRARLAGQADDRRRRAHQGRRLRLDRRHLGGAGRLLRRGRHPVHRAAAHAARSPSPSSSSRSPTAPWCCPSTPTSTAA